MKSYSVKKVAQLAGVSVRTLHYYDRLGLLRPLVRTESRYRLYAEQELMRLQQILFYKELDFALQEIKAILDDPEFDQRTALENHKQSLLARRDRLTVLLKTIDTTISSLNNEQKMMSDEELYAGFSRENAEAYQREAADKYGADVVEKSETNLRQLSKTGFDQLKAEQQHIGHTLATMVEIDPASMPVQQQIAWYFANILAFWGNSVPKSEELAAYKGLAQLYADDPRYTSTAGVANPAYAEFLRKAMLFFVEEQAQ